MKNEDYAYAVARIRANEARLLSGNDIENLIGAKSFDDCVSYLEAKGWADKTGSEKSVSQMIEYQNKKLWKLLSESVPDKAELSVFTVFNDFYNIKTALKCAFSKREPDNLFAFPTSLDTETIKTAVRNRDFALLSKDFELAAKEAFENANQTQSGQSADMILDKAALMLVSKKSHESNSELVREIFDFLCTVTNIKIAYRCAKTKKSFDFTKEALAPCGDADTEALALKATEGEEELVSYLGKTDYKKAAELISTDAAEFEKWCDNQIIEISKKAKMIFFGFEPICAYFYAKQNEIKTVRLVLYAKESGLAENIIRERVRALYV